jgi:hypothetical protein
MRHYAEFQATLPDMLQRAELESAEIGFFDRANFMDEFIRQRAAHPP